jgi:hypothetical protein
MSQLFATPQLPMRFSCGWPRPPFPPVQRVDNVCKCSFLQGSGVCDVALHVKANLGFVAKKHKECRSPSLATATKQ